MIEVYFDESGTHRGSAVLCVAAYAGTFKEWTDFTDEWGNQLKTFEISHFHAKSPKCDFLRPHLLNSINSRNLHGVVCSISFEDYRKYAGDHFKSFLGNGYAVCAFMCGLEFIKWAKENNLGRLSLFFENGQPNAEFVERILKGFMAEEDSIISSVAFAKKTEFLPLQTADFLSHEYCNHDTHWWNQLAQSGNVVHAHLTPEQIESTSYEIKNVNRHPKLTHFKA